MEMTTSNFLSLLRDPHFLLGSAIILVLLNYLLWKLLHSNPVVERILLWQPHMQPPHLPKLLAKLWPIIKWVRSKAKDLQAAQQVQKIVMRLLPLREDRVSRTPWRRIRQMLCDDPACGVCEDAAQEAGQYAVFAGTPSSHGLVDLKPGLPGRRGHQTFPRSASVPAPTSVPFDLGPVQPGFCHSSPGSPRIKKDPHLHFGEPPAHDWDEHSHPSSHRSRVAVFTSSSSTSYLTWKKSSSSLSEFSVESLTFSRSIHHLKMVLSQQEDGQESSWTDSKASSKHQQKSPFPQKEPCSKTSLVSAAPHLPARASKVRVTEFPATDAPFLEDAVIASLESHVLVKRVQHHLGLPLTLLRSLRSFMLPSPDLTPRKHLREFDVVIRPQSLSFVGSTVRKKLELHVKKMVRLKRWQLPQKIQGALGQMKPPFQPIEKKPPSAARKQSRGVKSQIKGTRRMQRTSAKRPTTEGVLDSKTTTASQAELQSHLVKKSLQIRLENFPTIVGHSQKMSSRSRILRLPKLIPLGQRCPQWRNRLCLLLRSKADAVDMNIKCKYIHFLWGLPTLYMQSLRKIAPGAPALPTAHAWVRATTEFVSMDPHFVETWVLEYHVLRKRLQHQWGLPGLILRSVKQFLMPVSSLPAHATSVLCSCLEVKIVISVTVFLSAHLELKETLEKHVKAKIVERRWGLPRRALDSLRVFIPVTPPLSQRPREGKKTFALPQGEKVLRRKPSSRAPRTSKTLMVSSGKALQRHLTKKALEVRLGTIAPMAQRSQDAARWVRKKQTLPKVIPPGLRPLVPRPPELLFVDRAVLGHLQLNVVHKGLMYRWGLITTYKKSLARMFQDTGTAPIALSPRKPTESKFTAVKTLFMDRGHREVLEWHIRRKSLQHFWGLPGLVQRSLRYLQPTTLSFLPQKGRCTEVAISLTEPTFLDRATRRELERNVQKRILNQQWQLPRRVLVSLRMLDPTWKADALAGSRGGFPRKSGHRNLLAPLITNALCAECFVKEMGGAAPPSSQGFPRLGSKNLEKIELHLTKKIVEVQLEAFPTVVKRSWKHTSSMSRLPLPKLVPPGRKPPQPRKHSLPLVSQEDAGRMEVAVRLCHLMSLWGLGISYVEGLRVMIPLAPTHSRGRRGKTVLKFSQGQALFLDSQAREALELHVRKKQLQHAWGLPVLIQSSVQAFVRGIPLASAFHRTAIYVQTLPQAPAFLPQGACSYLEHHLQKLKLQRQWGLPLRVLKSLHSLMPETEAHPHERTMMLLTRRFSAESSGGFRRRPQVEGIVASKQDNKGGPETMGAAPCRICQGSMSRGAALEKMWRHLAKKSVEIQLEGFPAVPRLSWRRASRSLKRPLPKLITPGQRVLESRQSSFPFLRTEEMDRVELAVRCSHLASLWGLGARYVEVVAAMAPSLPFRPVKSRRAAFGLPKGRPPCFQGLDPETLEMHIQKKRMQHEWGLPALALRSLGGFMQGTPTQPHRSKTVIHTWVLLLELPFLPRATCRLLEFHIQRMKLQRTWGLPARILTSLKAFLPSDSWGKPQLLLNYKEERFELVGSSAGETQRTSWACRITEYISSEQKGLEDHLKRKDLETHLEVFPALVRQSQAAASSWKKTPLPKPVRAGQKHPVSRVVSLSFLLPSTLDLLEVNVKQKHLAFLWGLSSQYVESLSMLAPRGHSPVGVSRERVRFQEAKTPFFQVEAREGLEHHIQKKRLHHHWELPTVIQRSLRALAPATHAHPRQKTSKEVNVLVADVPFVSGLAQKKLETSLKKMILHGRWGLPKRLQGYLRAFTAFPLADREMKDDIADRGITACMPDTKRAQRITRPPQTTYVGHVSRQALLQPYVPPILALYRSSKISALENHLKKKSLEIKLQSLVVGIGPIKRSSLPKCPPLSPVLKRRRAVLFMEPEALLKIELNIKRKYLTYLWGLPSLHSESMKKMFGRVPQWPQKKAFLRKEATWKGRGAVRPGKQTGSSTGFGSRSLKSPKGKLSSLTDEALDLLEIHVRHKKMQHEWGLPFTIQKSLRAFAPFLSEVQKSAPSWELPSMRPCCVEVSVTPQCLLFLDPAKRRQLEEHVRSRTVAHRWGIPRRVQQSLKMFLPPASLSQRSKDQAQTLLCQCDQPPQAATKPPQSKVGSLHGRITSRQISPRSVPQQEDGTQQRLLRAGEYPAELSPEEMHRDKTPRRGRKTREKMSPLAAKFLTSQAWDLLEFHIRRKRIQHEWGLPSLVQKSVSAFAPLPPGSRVSMKPRPGAYMAAKGWGVERTATHRMPLSVAEVSVPFQAVPFLDQDVRSRLEAHVRSRTAAHRWGLPNLVWDSLRAFLPPELHSQTCNSESHQQHETHSDSEREETSELHRVKLRAPEKQKKKIRQGNRAAGTHPGTKATAFLSPEKKPSFLTDEALGLLEFHIQHKKLQHLWGLPSTVLKSLRAFAPFPFETEKNMQHTGKISAAVCPWVRGEVQVITLSLFFLNPDTALHLEAHLRNLVARHRWGLPARVHQSLKGFLPPRTSSSSKLVQEQPLLAQPSKSLQVAAVGEGRHDDSMLRRGTTANQKHVHQKNLVATPSRRLKATAFSSSVGRLPFLTEEAQELLEFHMQRKKVQHMWGLPSAVLKSLRAFAPFPREPEKQLQDAAETLTKRHLWDTEVSIPAQSLFFLGPDTQEVLESHVRSRTAEHRWGLPKLVQKSLRALLPSASLSQSGETRHSLLHLDSESPQVPVIPPHIAMEGRKQASKELETEEPVAASSVAPAKPPATSLVTELPFLTDSKQDVLEFHIQHKKIQHEWGLPLTVQKSVHAFAPVPAEPHQRAPSTAGGDAAAVGAKDAGAEMGFGTKKPWITGMANVAVPSLHFLDSETKENLEAHLRNLTIEHRWALPRLVHKSMRAFIPLPSHLDIREMENEEQPLAYPPEKNLTMSDAHSPTEETKEASSEDQQTDHTEPFHEMEPGGGTASRLASEESLFCPGTKPAHAVAVPGQTGRWKVGRESPQRSTLQKRPPMKKATQRQRSMVFDPRWDPRISSLSSSSPGPKKYRSNASSWSTNLPRARYSSGRAPISRSSRTSLQKRKRMSQQAECGFQRVAEGSYLQAGTKQPDISYSNWELGRKKEAHPCACYLRVYRDDSGSSLHLDAEQRRGKAKGVEADSSEDTHLQKSGLSSEVSPRDGSHQKQESPSAHIMPVSAAAAPQHGTPTPKKAKSSLAKPAAVIQPYSICKDPSAGPLRQGGRGKSNSKLQKRGSRLGWNGEKKKTLPHLPRRQPSVRALRRQSSQDLCEACRSLKPPPLPKGSENPTSEAGSSSPDAGESNQSCPPVPQNQGSLERKGGFPGHPAHDLRAETDDNMADRKAKGGTISSSKEPRPLSTGGVSQFSTECEWEKVGDWATDEEASGGRERLSKEQGGNPRSAGEMHKMKASPKAQTSLKRASSPAAKQLQTSPNSAVHSKEGRSSVKIERNSVLRPGTEGRMIGREVSVQTARVAEPESSRNQTAREEGDKMLHRRREESRKGPVPSKEVLVRYGSRRLLGTPRRAGPAEREALKMVEEISKGIREQGNGARFIQGIRAKDVHRKLSLLGTIVEKKLLLRQGFRLWVESQEGEQGSRKRAKKSTGVSRPLAFQAAEVKWVEVQCCGSQEVVERRGSDRALPMGSQRREMGKMRSATLPGYPHRVSHRKKKEATRGRSRSRERKK